MVSLPDQGLPARFKRIERVQSIELRLKLTGLINSINSLIFRSPLEPDPKTKQLVDRFFRYLTHSCSDDVKINHRALWLSTFAKVVESHLLYSEAKYIASTFGEQPLHVNPVTTGMMDLANAICDYRTSKLGREEVDAGVLMHLTAILDMASVIKADSQSNEYLELVETIESVVMTVRILTHTKDSDPDDNDWSLLASVRMLRYDLGQYLLHTGMKVR
jgi:hypothetical protein